MRADCAGGWGWVKNEQRLSWISFQCVSFRLSVKAGMVVGEILRNPMVAR